MKTIKYGICEATGLVVSCVGSKVAIPILEYDKMLPENNFQPSYRLEIFSCFSLIMHPIKWTRKIPVELKNQHREFWGFKPLKEKG